jgi:hypothetical protein
LLHGGELGWLGECLLDRRASRAHVGGVLRLPGNVQTIFWGMGRAR